MEPMDLVTDTSLPERFMGRLDVFFDAHWDHERGAVPSPSPTQWERVGVTAIHEGSFSADFTLRLFGLGSTLILKRGR